MSVGPIVAVLFENDLRVIDAPARSLTLKFICVLSFVTVPLVWADGVSLCGDEDQKVCLENSATFQLTGPATLFNGTLIVLAVPDLNLNDPPFISGTVSVPYRLEQAGTVTDNLGNAWSAAQVIESDSRGAVAIRYQLLSGTLPPNARINLQDVRVCQYVSDGPGSVFLSVGIWGVLNKDNSDVKTPMPVTTLFKNDDTFISCSEGTNSQPLPRTETFAVSPFLDPVMFHLDAVDPETPSSQLVFSIEQLPLHGNVTVTGDGYAYQAFESFTGLDELVFTVSDSVNTVEGRIGFFVESTEAVLAFTELEGVVLVGEKVGPLTLEMMSLSERDVDIRMALDDAYFDAAINPNTLNEGLHVIRAELVDQSSLQTLATVYRYLYRRIESAETYLEVTNASAGKLLGGVYGDLEVHDYDKVDSYSFKLEGNQFAKLRVSGIDDGTLKLSVPPDFTDPWLFQKPVVSVQEIEIQPGYDYFVQVETKEEDAVYALDLRRTFPSTLVPLLEPDDRCVIHNPNGQSVILNWTEWPSGTEDARVLGAFAQLELNQFLGDANTSSIEIRSSLPVTTAILTRAQGDLDIVTQGPSSFLVVYYRIWRRKPQRGETVLPLAPVLPRISIGCLAMA